MKETFKMNLKQAEAEGNGNSIDLRLIIDGKTFHASYDTYYLVNSHFRTDLIDFDDYDEINEFELSDYDLNKSDIRKTFTTAFNRKNDCAYCGVSGNITLNGYKFKYECKLCDCY